MEAFSSSRQGPVGSGRSPRREEQFHNGGKMERNFSLEAQIEN